MLYDDRYHFHVGYYENGYDLEAVAFKRQSQGIWDIYFDIEHYGYKNNVQDVELKNFGIRIFSIENKELDYHDAAKKFEQWLVSQKMI
ncbi:DUF3986 family protein [Bacillus nitroreducens]